jgi:hypothetical protein
LLLANGSTLLHLARHASDTSYSAYGLLISHLAKPEEFICTLTRLLLEALAGEHEMMIMTGVSKYT